MTFVIDQIIIYLLFYKYITIFLVAFLAAVIVPIPSGSALMAAAAFASFGYFNIYYVVILSIIANIAGDNLSYYLAHRYGKKTLSKIGFRSVLESEKFTIVEERFKKHPGFIIFLTRFEVLSTLSVNLLSGMSNVSYRTFLFHEVLGSIAQVCFYAYIGYVFGDNWEYISSLLGTSFLIFFAVVAIIVFIVVKKKRHIHTQPQ